MSKCLEPGVEFIALAREEREFAPSYMLEMKSGAKRLDDLLNSAQP